VTENPAIETRGLGKRYGDRDAVADLTMRVMRGEVFGFLGPNGAGKTTVVKMLLGLVHPTAGVAAILGRPLGSLAVRRKIGYLPELFRYPEWLSAREVLAWHAALLRVSRERRGAEIDMILRRVGLAERAGDRIGTFSKGMQQRLGIGVALIGSPDLIFLDEPTSALDPVGRADIRKLIADLKAAGTTIFLNSHLLSEVEHVCDRVAVIDGGRAIAIGELGELLGRFALRISFESIDAALRAELLRREATFDGTTTALLHGLSDANVPDVVAELVALGARIKAVQPIRSTLEERFLEILRTEHERTADRIPRSA
jgi:ABC-2 type transport system ATP-binding protein